MSITNGRTEIEVVKNHYVDVWYSRNATHIKIWTNGDRQMGIRNERD